ncbi:MAG: tetratricopeptide repeat protein [Acidobacteriota bacterium]
MSLRNFTILFCLFVGSVVNSFAQPSPAMQAANELMKQQKFTEAAAAYEAIVKTEPKNAPAWSQLGTARYSLKQYQPAADAWVKNVAITDNGFTKYNLACAYSLMGDKAKAIEWLTKTVSDPKMVLPAVNFKDPDLAAIKDDPAVVALHEKVERTIHPCLFSDEAKQFNFWVGEWEVFNPQGRHDGSSAVQSIASGCGILENWTDQFGGTGKSINFYDAAAGKWFQYWIGQAGGPLRFSGVYKDGAIRYEGEPSTTNGQKTLTRLTFFNIDANTVRQFAESSSDGGKTWTTSYDYKYVRRAK